MVFEKEKQEHTFHCLGSQPPESLLRGSSIEELVKSPHSLPLGEGGVPVSLKVCLSDLFEKGWSPERHACGLVRLVEETVLWLKSIEKSGSKMEFPPIVDELLKTYRSMVVSTDDLEKINVETSKIMSTARATVEQRVQDALASTKHLDASESESILSQQKNMLESWLASKDALCKEHVEEVDVRHRHIRNTFEDKIQEVVNLAFDEWKSSRALIQTKADPTKLHQELDAELEASLSKMDTTSVDQSQLSGTTSTEVFMKLQQVIGETLEEGQVPEALKDKLVDHVQSLFKTAFEPGTSATTGGKLGETETKEDVETRQEETLEKPKEPVMSRLIIPKGCDEVIVQKKFNIFDPQVVKEINWEKGSGPLTGPTSGVVPSTAPVSEACKQPTAPTPSAVLSHRVAAVQQEFTRKDTTDIEKADRDKDMQVVNGETFYVNPKGRLETLSEREARLAHNSFMRFSRSLQGFGFYLMKLPLFVECRSLFMIIDQL